MSKQVDVITNLTEKTKYGISSATIRNWNRLDTIPTDRLTTRANKRKSRKRFVPMEYINNEGNIVFVHNILDYLEKKGLDILSGILSLGISLLKEKGIYDKQCVETVLSEYADIAIISDFTEIKVPEDEFDILGLLYQSYLREGEKNIKGSYYTPQRVAYNMTKAFDFSSGKLFLDPCCGSGAFLLSVEASNPSQIYGVDNDKIAVLISKINLLLKYKDFDFVPQVYCFDFLAEQPQIFEKKFDYIATNPPWGAMDEEYTMATITTNESFSYFFIKSYEYLKSNGTIRFLFPEAILKVKAHKDIRKYILEKAGIVSISMYNDTFSNVTTKFIDIECCNKSIKDHFNVYIDNRQRTVDIKTVYETENNIFNLLSKEDTSIIRTVKNRGEYSLKNSIWALGIVTGDNKRKLFTEKLAGMEKIYTGKEIQQYVLRPAQRYIMYDRNDLQQVASEDIYRAPEKLVYKFISNKLVFAYDNTASLFLNSANILIPDIPIMSTKTVMAFLNSILYQYLYSKLFGEVKILKGNLTELPFPLITEKDNERITFLVDEIIAGKSSNKEAIDNYIFSIFDLADEQIMYIRSEINGNTH